MKSYKYCIFGIINIKSLKKNQVIIIMEENMIVLIDP